MSTVALLFGRLYVIFEEEEKNGGRKRKAIEMEGVVQSTHHGLSPVLL